MKISVNGHTLLLFAGWVLAACASVALLVQHIKWTHQQDLWRQALGEQELRVVELETIIADLHLDIDQGEPVVVEAADKTTEAISNVFDRVRSAFKRRASE